MEQEQRASPNPRPKSSLTHSQLPPLSFENKKVYPSLGPQVCLSPRKTEDGAGWWYDTGQEGGGPTFLWDHRMGCLSNQSAHQGVIPSPSILWQRPMSRTHQLEMSPSESLCFFSLDLSHVSALLQLRTDLVKGRGSVQRVPLMQPGFQSHLYNLEPLSRRKMRLVSFPQ